MKFLSILPLLALVKAATYDNCKRCKVITEEDGVSWGVENKQWCSKYLQILK